MNKIIGRITGALLALGLSTGLATAASKVTVAIGGGACLCYLPTVLAKQLGEYQKAGLDVELVDLKGGSDALKAVLGGSADVVSGYFDHCVNLAAKKQEMQSFVVYDRYPGLVLVVSPSHNKEINSIKDLAGKKVGVSAPGSSTDFFLKYLLKKNGLDPTGTAVIGVGLGATAVAAMEQGQIDAAVMLDPSVTVLQGTHPDLKILSDTRTQHDTLEVFGGEYPGGALYSTVAWIAGHEKETQALTNAIVATLGWIHAHSPEEIMAKMPEELVGKDKALYLAALKNTIPMYSQTGKMDPKGADAVLAVFSTGSPDVAKANIDVSKTFTNKFVEQAKGTTGTGAKQRMTGAVIHRVTALDLKVEPWDWPFARERRDDIAAHFAERQREKPGLWNGRILLGRDARFDGGTFSASYFEADFASLLAWRDWGFPDRTAFNGFGMGALRASDGAFVLGEMGAHTANAGRLYFPAGTPDLDDVRDGTLDLAANVAREVEEETGLAPADYQASPHWDCVVTGASIALMRVLDAAETGEILKRRIEANLAAQDEPELSAIRLVRSRADLTAAMPHFVTAFLNTQFSEPERSA